MSEAIASVSWAEFWRNLPAILAAIGALYGAFKVRKVKQVVERVDLKTDQQNVVLKQTEANTNGNIDRVMKLVERVTDPGMPGGQRATDPQKKE